MSNELIKKAYEHFEGAWPSGWTAMVVSKDDNSVWGEGEYQNYGAGKSSFYQSPKVSSSWQWVGTKDDFDAYSDALANEINWHEAPEGATAYCYVSGYPWLKMDSKGEVLFFNDYYSKWKVFKTQIVGKRRYDNAIKKPVETNPWMPEVGEECEVLFDNNRESPLYLKAKILLVDGDNVIGRWLEGRKTNRLFDYTSIFPKSFRPIKTEREQLIEIIDSCNMSSGVLADAILNTGYRKADGE